MTDEKQNRIEELKKKHSDIRVPDEDIRLDEDQSFKETLKDNAENQQNIDKQRDKND